MEENRKGEGKHVGRRKGKVERRKSRDEKRTHKRGVTATCMQTHTNIPIYCIYTKYTQANTR